MPIEPRSDNRADDSADDREREMARARYGLGVALAIGVVAVPAAMVVALGVSPASVAAALAPAKSTTTATVPSSAVTYRIDPTHSQVRVNWDHMGLSNPGATFANVQGVIRIDEAHPERSSVSVTIPVASVDTGVKQLTNDFLTDKFFDVAAFPEIQFESRDVSFTGVGRRFVVTGDVIIHGITRPVLLHAQLNGSGFRPGTQMRAAGFNASTRLKRSDFGLTPALAVVSDEVDLAITVEAVAEGEVTK